MKRTNTYLAALTSAALLGFAAPSQATLIVSEDFSYANGALAGNNGGTGFSGAWASGNGADVSGGVATTAANGDSTATRSLAAPFASSGTLWLSFDWGYNAQPTQGGSYGGLTFYIGGTEKFLIGNTWPDPLPHDVWQMNGTGGTTSVTNYPVMKTGVARITLGAGLTSTVDLWVGPTGSPVDVSGPALASVTGRELAGVDGIRILGYSGNGAVQSFDNLLIGTTMGDVNAVPEPSSLAMLAFGGVFMWLFKGRRGK